MIRLPKTKVKLIEDADPIKCLKVKNTLDVGLWLGSWVWELGWCVRNEDNGMAWSKKCLSANLEVSGLLAIPLHLAFSLAWSKRLPTAIASVHTHNIRTLTLVAKSLPCPHWN